MPDAAPLTGDEKHHQAREQSNAQPDRCFRRSPLTPQFCPDQHRKHDDAYSVTQWLAHLKIPEKRQSSHRPDRSNAAPVEPCGIAKSIGTPPDHSRIDLLFFMF